MKKTARLIALAVVVFAMQGCAVAALVAAASWAGKNGENTRMEFQRLNMDRQEKGLAPLTWEDFKKGRTPDERTAESYTLGNVEPPATE